MSTTVRACAANFKKTHQDTWHEDQSDGSVFMDDDSDEEIMTPIKPSAKALGKRKVEVNDDPERKLYPFRFFLPWILNISDSAIQRGRSLLRPTQR